MVFYNAIYTVNTAILHVICHLSEKVPLEMVCGIVKVDSLQMQMAKPTKDL